MHRVSRRSSPSGSQGSNKKSTSQIRTHNAHTVDSDLHTRRVCIRPPEAPYSLDSPRSPGAKKRKQALDVVRANQRSLEIEECLFHSLLQEEEVARKHLYQDMEKVRARWQAASHDVGKIVASILARGLTPRDPSPPPMDDHTLAREELEEALQEAGFEGTDNSSQSSNESSPPHNVQPLPTSSDISIIPQTKRVSIPTLASLSVPFTFSLMVPLVHAVTAQANPHSLQQSLSPPPTPILCP
ncbi:hypothetical protein BDZ94DRAFT_1327453 [Collybia nuda]|uniref:Uncharacterized protein n=1 Tax=Collybia nuda TaxID=64659 RepID=A0A9P6CC24_9AGAR|nr:hypothetical protein BDZ94DRAFT_1327453 [Collybia nuda]